MALIWIASGGFTGLMAVTPCHSQSFASASAKGAASYQPGATPQVPIPAPIQG